MLQCAGLIDQMKGLDTKMTVERIIVTKGQFIIEFWISELGVVDQISEKEAEN